MRSAARPSSAAAIARKTLGPEAQRAVRLAALARAVERLVVGGAVFVVGGAPTTRRVLLASAVALATMGLRAALAMRADLRVRNDLYLAVADSLTDADAMQPVPLPGDDAEGALSDAVYSVTHILAIVMPYAYGDIAACLILAPVVVCVVLWLVMFFVLFAFS